jgi:hypothetical protein
MTQLKTPPQSPVEQAAPAPLFPFKLLAPVPAALKLQFVLPQTRPCQSALTVRLLLDPGGNSNPPVPAPVPACVPIPGHIVPSHWLLTTNGTESRFSGGPHLAGRGSGPALFVKYLFVV